MSEKLTNMLEPAAGEGTSLASLLKQPVYAKRFEAVLGERAAQFASSLISIGNTMRDVEPKSIIGSSMIAAALDLPIDKNLGFAWIVPYRKDGQKLAQFQLGWKGLVQLGQRSSQYARMNATTINEEVFKGYDEVGEPELDWNQYDPAKPVWGYFFGFKLTNGFTKKAVWTKAKVLEHAKRYSQSYRSDAAIWRDQFDAMATKTVVANTLRKWGPMSVQLQRALQADQAIVPDMDAEPIYPEIEDAKPEKPIFEHPAQKEQAEQQKTSPATAPKAKAKTETKSAPATVNVSREVKPEPTPTSPAPGKPEPAPVPAPAPVIEPTAPVATQAPAPTPLETSSAPAGTGFGVPVTPTPEQQESAELAAVTAMPAEEPAKPKVQSEAQTQLHEVVFDLGFTWEDFLGWGRTAIPKLKSNPPSSWMDIADEDCRFYIKNKVGVGAGIRAWKNKK